MTTDNTELAQSDLRRLSRMLGEFEIVKDLIDVYGIAVVEQATELLRANQIDEDADKEPALSDTLKKAFAHTPQARGQANLVLGKNRTPIINNGKVTKTSSFKDIVNSADRSFNKIANEDQTLPWVRSSSVPSNKPRIVKDAILKSRAIQQACREEHAQFAVKETAMSILKAHSDRKLQEAALTAAQKTIVAKPSAAEGSVASQLPSAWKNSKEPAELSVEREINVRNSLPDDRKPKITPTVNQSFAARTAAAKTLDRGKNMEVPNPEINAQGEVADKFWPHPTMDDVEDAEGKKTIPQYRDGKAVKGDKQWDVDLKKPKDAVQNNDPTSSYTGAI